jgi:hypothetical protein
MCTGGVRFQTRSIPLVIAHIRHVNVGAEAHIVGQVPAIMIRVFIDDDLIVIPKPVVAEIVIVGSHAEVEAIEKEAFSVSTAQAENMTASESARKPSMFKRAIDTIVRVITPRVMADPLIVGMYVGSVGMSGLIDKSPVPLCGGLLDARRFLDPCGC